MAGITVDGQQKLIPGAYGQVNIVSNVGAAIPDFNVGAVLASAEKGTPYNFVSGSLKKQVETTRPVFTEYGGSSQVAKVAGEDSELATAFRYAKKHGLTRCYVAIINALTRPEANLLDSVPAAAIRVFSKEFGAPLNWTKIAVTANGGDRTITVTPVKSYVMLTANATLGSNRIKVKSIDRLKVGQKWWVAANDTTPQELEIKELSSRLDANGQYEYFVTFTANLAAAHSTAQYALMFQEDTNNTNVSPALTTNEAIVDWFNSALSKYLGATKTTDTLIAALSATYIGKITGATQGTSPDPAGGDWTSFFDLMDTELTNFEVSEKRRMRLFLQVDGTPSNHLKFRDFLIARRNLRKPMAGICGTLWGSVAIDAGGDTNPTTLAAALNNQDTQFATGGGDYLDGYLTHGPALFGLRIGNTPAHNLTRDKIVFSTLEKMWDEDGAGQISKLLRFGCSAIDRNRDGFFIVQGINTLQANDFVWNTDTEDTAFPMNRDLADLVERTVLEWLNAEHVGADNVTSATLAVGLQATFKKLKDNGFLKEGITKSILPNSEGNGFDVEWDAKQPNQNDFFRVTMNIIVGERTA